MAIHQVDLGRYALNAGGWPTIDWNHKQASGLECYLPFRFGPQGVEMRTGKAWTRNGATPLRVTPQGTAIDIGGTDYLSLAFPDAPFIGAAGLTILWSGIIDTGSGFRDFASKSAGNGATSSPFCFFTSNDATPVLQVTRAALAYNYFGGPSVTLGAYRVYAVRFADQIVTTTPDFFVGGAKTAGSLIGGAGVGSVTGSEAEIRIGRRADGAVQMDGACDEVRIYSRALPDALIAEISDPERKWDLLRGSRARRSFASISAGASVGSLWWWNRYGDVAS